MAVPYQVDANNEEFTIVDDCTTRYWAVITGAATDETFGTLNAPGFSLELQRTDFATKAFDNGLYAITAYPNLSFPQLATTSYTVNFTIAAPGFRDFPVTVTIPANAIFPVPAPATPLRRLPVRLQGRAVNNSTRAAISGSSIMSIDPTPTPTVHATVLRSPLYFPHAKGAAAQQVSIAVTSSATLTQAVTGGDQVLNLSIRTGLAANSIVRLTNGGGVLLEYGVVDHLGPGAASAPGQVFLRSALNRSYPIAATSVDFVNETAVGTPASLAADADAGDGVLLASQLFSGTVALEIGGALAELHEAGAMSDSDGYYALDGVGRVQQLNLQATQAALQATVDWFVEYDQPINLVDFRLS